MRPSHNYMTKTLSSSSAFSENSVPQESRKLTQYVTNVDATFPTAILLSVSSDHAIFDTLTSTLNIVRHSKVAKVIDGQHRIAGLKGYEGPDFDVNVAVFVDMDIQDQAMVFATINLKQTKVNKSLAYDLYEFTKSRSPQKSAHDIARLLNYRTDSPFYRGSRCWVEELDRASKP